MKTPTVSIDLGASYTKVAYRGPLARHGRHRFANADSQMTIVEGTVTIPSVMIQTGDRHRPWCAGREAADMTPDAKMKVFANWKSALYSTAFDAKKVDLVWVAGNFFNWLLGELVKLGIECDQSFRIRVTIPALKRIEEQKSALIQCMKLNGWPDNIDVVVEPKANIVGVLSGGRNVVSASGQISYQPTFGNSDGTGPAQLGYVFDEIRNFALGSRRKRHMKISVVDFGSFTLDVANLTLDLKVIDHETFPIQDVDSHSWEIGIIEDVDRPCFTELFARHGINADSLSFNVKERTKTAIYSGEAYAPIKGRTVIGETESDKATIAAVLESYCHKAWSHVAPLCHDSEVVVLTGGGTCIPRIREYFRAALYRRGVANVVDFSSGQKTVDGEADSNGLHDWEKLTEGLGRLATGIGGASIALGFDPDAECRGFLPRGSPL